MTTLYDVAGGREGLLAMTRLFYDRAVRDDLIGAMFSAAAAEHAEYLAGWLSASFGGPRDYLATRGDLSFVIWKHAGLDITEAQRRRWADLMMQAARDTGKPDAFLAPYGRFVEAITGSVRQHSRMPLPEMRAMLGLPPGGAIRPLRDDDAPAP
ncbi:hypothetical protein [Jannaschia sp. LMIT008]|uniref:globin domain-containing protein n=1 Tax=Jannaschia maritima TaxID=3032585 RepID=UPI00281181C4|nr:hypothetical protein [Jannaschia sp. LMIT008]